MRDAPFALTREQVRAIDRRAIEEYGVPGVVLMENAGRGATELLMALNPEKQPVVICCGPGNNGGDGFVIARHLDIHHFPVEILLFAEPETLAGDAAVNFRIVERSGIHIRIIAGESLEPELAGLDNHLRRDGWIVDALFGTGLSGPLRPPFDRVVEAINASGMPVFAVDIPSGLDCDTGRPLGPTVRARHTATFVALKKGFLDPAAKGWTGEVHVVGIGAPRRLIEET